MAFFEGTHFNKVSVLYASCVVCMYTSYILGMCVRTCVCAMLYVCACSIHSMYVCMYASYIVFMYVCHYSSRMSVSNSVLIFATSWSKSRRSVALPALTARCSCSLIQSIRLCKNATFGHGHGHGHGHGNDM